MSLRRLTQEQNDFFRVNGYLHLPSFLSPDEIEKLRETCFADFQGDSLGKAGMKEISIHPQITTYLHDLLGSEIEYPGLSKVICPAKPSQGGRRGYHDDALGVDVLTSNGLKQDYQDDSYNIVNTAIYLQDHDVYSGGLKLIPGSHRFACLPAENFFVFFKKLVKFILRDFNFSVLKQFTNASRNVPTKAGDFVVWSLRTHHSGYGKRLKFAPNCSLPPLIENWIPKFLCRPEQKPRCAILTVYAGKGEYFNRYYDLQLLVKKNINHWNHSSFDRPELVERAKQAGVNIRTKSIRLARTYFSD